MIWQTFCYVFFVLACFLLTFCLRARKQRLVLSLLCGHVELFYFQCLATAVWLFSSLMSYFFWHIRVFLVTLHAYITQYDALCRGVGNVRFVLSTSLLFLFTTTLINV